MAHADIDTFRPRRIRVRPARVNGDHLMLHRGLALVRTAEWQAAHPETAPAEPQCDDCGGAIDADDACDCTLPTMEEHAREAMALAARALTTEPKLLADACFDLYEVVEALLAERRSANRHATAPADRPASAGR